MPIGSPTARLVGPALTANRYEPTAPLKLGGTLLVGSGNTRMGRGSLRNTVGRPCMRGPKNPNGSIAPPRRKGGPIEGEFAVPARGWALIRTVLLGFLKFLAVNSVRKPRARVRAYSRRKIGLRRAIAKRCRRLLDILSIFEFLFPRAAASSGGRFFSFPSRQGLLPRGTAPVFAPI